MSRAFAKGEFGVMSCIRMIKASIPRAVILYRDREAWRQFWSSFGIVAH
jgi:hypothetical protein